MQGWARAKQAINLVDWAQVSQAHVPRVEAKESYLVPRSRYKRSLRRCMRNIIDVCESCNIPDLLLIRNIWPLLIGSNPPANSSKPTSTYHKKMGKMRALNHRSDGSLLGNEVDQWYLVGNEAVSVLNHYWKKKTHELENMRSSKNRWFKTIFNFSLFS